MVPAQARVGLDPVTFGDILDFEGRLIPTGTKDAWMALVTEAGGLAV